VGVSPVLQQSSVGSSIEIHSVQSLAVEVVVSVVGEMSSALGDGDTVTVSIGGVIARNKHVGLVASSTNTLGVHLSTNTSAIELEAVEGELIARNNGGLFANADCHSVSISGSSPFVGVMDGLERESVVTSVPESMTDDLV